MLALYQIVSLRYQRLRFFRTVLVLVSIALGVGTWVATGVLYRDLEESISAAATPLAEIADLHVSNGNAGVPLSLAKVLTGFPGVRVVRPLLIEPVKIVLGNDQRRAALLLGLDPAQSLHDQASWTGRGNGELVSKEDWPGLLLEYQAARVFGQTPVLIGKELESLLPPGARTIKILAAGGIHELTRVGPPITFGPIAALNRPVLVMDCNLAAKLLERPGRVSRFDIVLEPGVSRDEVQGQIKDKLIRELEGLRSEHLAMLGTSPLAAFPGTVPWGALASTPLSNRPQVLPPEAGDQRIRDVLAGLRTGFMVCGTGALIVGMFLVYNALSVSVTERRHDIGILRSLGATRGQVRSLFVGEALLLGMTGSFLGIPLGWVLSRLASGPLRQLVSDTVLALPQRTSSLKDLTGHLVGAVLAGVITTLVASVLPALRAAQEEPADAVRRVPPSQRWPLRLGQLAGSLLLAGIGVALVAFKDHLPPRVGSFAGVGFLFLGSFLAMALMSALVARVFQPLTQNLFSVEDRLAADNLIRSPGRTGRVIAALAACVALLIQTAGVIRSHEKAILSWLEHSVTADLIVTAGGPISSSGQNVPMKADLAYKIEEVLPGSKAVAISFRYVDWPYREGETLILIMAVDTGLYYQRNRQRGANVPQLDLYWRLSQEPGTAVVSQNFSQLHRLKEGDSFTIPGYEGPVPLQVIGVIEDYTWNRGSVLVHRDHISRAFQTNLVDAFDVFLSAPEETETARKTLQNSSLAADHSLFVLTEEGLRTHVSNLIHRLYGLAYSQEVVVGLVAALGEVTALLISVLQRRRELGLLRAVGATQVQVLRSVLAEAFLMGIIGGLLGVAFGLVLEWYAVRVILLEEGGFSFPISLPWLEVLVFVGLALVLALSAGLLPALQAVRLRLADALAYE